MRTAQKAATTRQDAPGLVIRRPVRLSPARSKYGVRLDAAGKAARTCDGILFDSKVEARRYAELRLLERAGTIWDLELQPVFTLSVPSTTGTMAGAAKALAGTFDGRIGTVRLDFAYHTPKGRVFEDVKGGRSLPLARWKFKHLAAQYGITVTEIRYR